ncbi:MAG: DUF2225 domain-containing protein [bacterium]
MVGLLYSKELTCPICLKQFKTKRARRSKVVIAGQDSDFCPRYKSEDNPIFYDPTICPKCGYGAMKDDFEDITDHQKIAVLKNITPKWNKRNYGGRRNVADAIECYRHILENARVMHKKASTLATICMRLAWCYRYNQDPREDQFVRLALKHYQAAYEKEKLPIKKLNAITLLYIIGELNRRLGNTDKALQYFSRVVEHPKRFKNQRIEKMAREQWHKIKDEQD